MYRSFSRFSTLLLILALSACSSRRINKGGVDTQVDDYNSLVLACTVSVVGSTQTDATTRLYNLQVSASLGSSPVQSQIKAVTGGLGYTAVPTAPASAHLIPVSTRATGEDTFRFTVSDLSTPSQSASCQVKVVIPGLSATPSVNLVTLGNVNSLDVFSGTVMPLMWSGTNVTSCNIKKNGVLVSDLSGITLSGLSGIFSSGPLTADAEFVAACVAGTEVVTSKVNFHVLNLASVSLQVNGSAAPFPLAAPGTVPLSWSSSGMAMCLLFANGNLVTILSPPEGGAGTVVIGASTLYRISCTTQANPNAAPYIAEVYQAVGSPSNISLAATPTSVVPGNKVTLTWSSSQVVNCAVIQSNQDNSNPELVSNLLSGSAQSVEIFAPARFHFACTTSQGSVVNKVVDVGIIGPTVPTACTLPQRPFNPVAACTAYEDNFSTNPLTNPNWTLASSGNTSWSAGGNQFGLSVGASNSFQQMRLNPVKSGYLWSVEFEYSVSTGLFCADRLAFAFNAPAVSSSASLGDSWYALEVDMFRDAQDPAAAPHNTIGVSNSNITVAFTKTAQTHYAWKGVAGCNSGWHRVKAEYRFGNMKVWVDDVLAFETTVDCMDYTHDGFAFMSWTQIWYANMHIRNFKASSCY